MVKEVVWTSQSIKTYRQITDYLEREFGENTVAIFIKTVHKKIDLIFSNPFLFRKSTKRNNVFLTVIHKRTLLVYRYKPIKQKIELITFWDTRQNPKKLKY